MPSHSRCRASHHFGPTPTYTVLTPFLVCSPAAAAIDFYVAVFGAAVVERMDGQHGTLAHAELDLGAGRLQLGDPDPRYGLVAPVRGRDADSSSTCVYVPDVDAVFAAAEEARRRLAEWAATES